MKTKTNLKLPLKDSEKANLRKHRVRMVDIPNYAVDELEVLLDSTTERAGEILALAEFQSVPSIGIRFAEDLVFLGYHSLSELRDKDGAELTDDYEKKKGYQTDPCVEDQFRLVVDFAKTKNEEKRWWDFTEERKRFRLEHGYPADRPKEVWHEVLTLKTAQNKRD